MISMPRTCTFQWWHLLLMCSWSVFLWEQAASKGHASLFRQLWEFCCLEHRFLTTLSLPRFLSQVPSRYPRSHCIVCIGSHSTRVLDDQIVYLLVEHCEWSVNVGSVGVLWIQVCRVMKHPFYSCYQDPMRRETAYHLAAKVRLRY